MKKILLIVALIVLTITLSGCSNDNPPCDNVVRVTLTDDTTYVYEDVCRFATNDMAFDGTGTVYQIIMHSYVQNESESVVYEADLVKSIGYITLEEE